MYAVYIIRNRDSRCYIGVTSDVTKRLKYHNSGKNRSTKRRGEWKLIHTEYFLDKKSAWFRERQIKRYKGGEAFKKLIDNGGLCRIG